MDSSSKTVTISFQEEKSMTKKSTKKALVLSLLSLVVCISMLVGSTFAWFTDNVVSAGNVIKSGNLDVTLEWLEGNADPNAENAQWMDASQTAIFNYELWEPGYTCVRHVKIANVGSLALKYKAVIKANGEVTDLSDVIDVYYADPAVGPMDERADMSGLTRLGTLTEVLAGMGDTANGTLASKDSDVITLALKMQESAGNTYEDKSIGTNFSVVVYATQVGAESDSFDNTYDNGAVYDDEVQLESQPWHELDAVHTDTVVDGGGYTFAEEYQEIALVAEADVTIKGVTFQNGLTLYTDSDANGTITLENCTIYLNDGNGNTSNSTLIQHYADYGLYIGAISPNVSYVFKNCKFSAYDTHTYTNNDKGYNVYIGGNYSADSITFDGCTFEKSSKHGIGCSFDYIPDAANNTATYYNLTVTGCNFVDWNKGNYDGAAIRGNVPADILTAYNKSINISGNTFGNSNGSKKANVAIDGWSGSWS